MEKHEQFRKWAVSKGVKIYGIRAHRFEGRGIGIVAEKSIEAGSVILTVPTTALRTLHTVPKSISSKIGQITVHGLLATDLCFDTSAIRAPWHAVLPTMEDFRASMPLLQDAAAQSRLPAESRALVENQQRKFDLDWKAASSAFPELDRERYLYNWLLVNTRTFYYVRPGLATPANHDDCMALNPFADYFNHAARGCAVEYTQKGFTVFADRAYGKGEEIYISYGNHSNAFLLAEYGFTMEDNEWDTENK